MKTLALGIALLATSFSSFAQRSADQPKLELVFADNTYQLTGVAVSAKGRVFTNYPLWSDTYKYALVEIVNGKAIPYPDEAMNSWKPGEPGKDKWVCVQSPYIDDQDNMWVVDPAAPKMQKVVPQSHKLVKINLSTNKVERTYTFEGTADESSYLNDVRVDTKLQFAYLTNSNTGGILVVDLKSGKTRQLLQGHYSVRSDANFKFIIDGKELTKDGAPMKMHSDGIALTPDGVWLYYKPLTDKKLYRIKTEDLRNEALNSQQLASKVMDLGQYTTTDGMICDPAGNLYLGDLQTSSLIKIAPDLKMTTLLHDDRLIWPDSYAVSKDGYLFVTCSQIQKQPDYNGGVNKRTTPYTIYKVRLKM
jgi:sugar lactone lactonase YvrE